MEHPLLACIQTLQGLSASQCYWRPWHPGPQHCIAGPLHLRQVGIGVLRQALRFAREAGRHPFNYVPHFYLCGLNRKNFTPETNSDEEKLWLEMCGDIHGGHYEACAIFEFIMPIPLTERMGSPIKSEP